MDVCFDSAVGRGLCVRTEELLLLLLRRREAGYLIG